MTRCPPCGAVGEPFQTRDGRTFYRWNHLPYCPILRTLNGAAQPRDETDYLDGDYRGTAYPYERGDVA